MKDIKFAGASIVVRAVCEYGRLLVPKTTTAGPFQPNWVKTFTTVIEVNERTRGKQGRKRGSERRWKEANIMA